MCGAMQGRQQAKESMDFDNPLTFFPDGETAAAKPSDMFDYEVTPLTIAGIPKGGMMGFTEDELHRRKALQDIINTPGYDPATRTEAQRQWILLQQKGRA